MTDWEAGPSSDQIARVLRRRWWVVAQCIVAASAAALLLGVGLSTTYKASAVALVEGGGASRATDDRLAASTAARLATTRAVTRQASRQLGGRPSAAEIRDHVTAKADDAGGFVSITASAGTPDQAARIANAVADRFVAARAEGVTARTDAAIAQGRRELATLSPRSAEYRSLSAQLAELRVTALLPGGDVQIIDPAVAPAPQTGSAALRRGLIGAALGLLLGLVLVFALEALDPRVRTLRELRALAGVPQLAALPTSAVRSRRRKHAPVLRLSRREPFEHMRAGLFIFSSDTQRRRLVVTSPTDRREGKTAVVASLAVSLARSGLRVCVVDADLRRPALAEQFDLDASAGGLAELVRGSPLTAVVQRFELGDGPGGDHYSNTNGNGNGDRRPTGAHVSVVATGTGIVDPAELLDSAAAAAALDRLDEAFDIVLLDCPPVLASSDALGLLEHATGTLLVVRHFRTARRSVSHAIRVLEHSGSPVIGLVATGVPKGELSAEGSGPSVAVTDGSRLAV